MNELDTRIREHYLGKHLSDDAMQRILHSGQQQQSKREAQQNQRELPTTGWGNIAVVRFSEHKPLVASVVGFLLLLAVVINYPKTHVAQSVFAEVAMNHTKQLNVEYPLYQFNELQKAMTKLDFPLKRPQQLANNFQLIGGRYCSIQGALAAQLKVKDQATGDIATLYITPSTDHLSKIKEQQTHYKSVDIKVWQSQGMFFALAGS